jgi:hypothetical protein
MTWAFALPESVSVAWGAHGVWLSRDDAFPADDPFVVAHPAMFSLTPSRARASDGRAFEQVPLLASSPTAAATPAALSRRGRAND